MITRCKILMSVVQELGGKIDASRLHLLLFLFLNKYLEHNPYYDFIPTNDGPFSLQTEEDKNYLIHKKYLENSPDWIAFPADKRCAHDLDFFEKLAINRLNKELKDTPKEELLNIIQTNFPDFGKPINDNNATLFTIGYEGKSPDAYISLLIKNNVRMLCDVRKNPISKKYGFSKGDLSKSLQKVGIKYMHMPELGIASEKRQNLDDGSSYHNLFEEYEKTTLAAQGNKIMELNNLLNDNRRIAITCFEADVHHCHRSRVANAIKKLEGFSYPIKHL